MTRRRKIEDIVESLKNEGYNFININKYESVNVKCELIDGSGYKYYSTLSSIFSGSKPNFVSISNPFSIENIKLWIKLNNKNFELISDKFEGCEIKLKWKCLDENCGEEYDTIWNAVRGSNVGCPYCSGLKVGDKNSLAICYPEVAKEWHPTLNGDLTSHDVSKATSKEYWWICEHGHEWKTKLSNRTLNKTRCPYCTGRFATEEENITTTNPELMLDWDYNKNKMNPKFVKRGSNEWAWWKCHECGHEWETVIRNRGLTKNPRGCPMCKKSKGEKAINKWLISNKIKFTDQKEYSDLFGTGGGLLSYDFYLPNYNLLIEYQGEYHDCNGGKGIGYVKEVFPKQQEHDRRKKEYAEQHNIKLLEIWYWDFDNIEKILHKELLEIDCQIKETNEMFI